MSSFMHLHNNTKSVNNTIRITLFPQRICFSTVTVVVVATVHVLQAEEMTAEHHQPTMAQQVHLLHHQ
jgi:hypothetical protein